MTIFVQIISLMLGKTAPFLLAGFGGLLSELSGVINFALEGMMLSGAFAAMAGARATGSPWLGLLFGVLAGILAGAIHALASLQFRANQIVSSIGVNLLAAGLTGLLLNQVFGVYGTSGEVPKLPDLAALIPVHSSYSGLRAVLEGVSVLIPVSLAIAAFLVFFLGRTVTGLHLKACGENPAAAAAAGLSPNRVRFFAVCAGGALAGMGGAYLSIGELSQFVENMTQGRGYMAVAAIILGRWRPVGVLLAVFFFGLCDVLSEWLAVRWSMLPNQFFLALPYAACFAVLGFYSGKKRPPSALGRLS